MVPLLGVVRELVLPATAAAAAGMVVADKEDMLAVEDHSLVVLDSLLGERILVEEKSLVADTDSLLVQAVDMDLVSSPEEEQAAHSLLGLDTAARVAGRDLLGGYLLEQADRVAVGGVEHQTRTVAVRRRGIFDPLLLVCPCWV